MSHCVICLSLNVPQVAENEKRECDRSQVSEKQFLAERQAMPALRPIFVSVLRKQEKYY